jgi:hypothetical protein
MFGLRFEEQPAIVAADPNRADVACFVGFVAQRPGPLPAEVARWLLARRWIQDAGAPADLRQLPVPIDTWEIFDRLFAWEQRLLRPGSGQLPTYLGAAIRSFFAQGGRKCYVVAAGEPWPYLEAPGNRRSRMDGRLEALLPGYVRGGIDASAADPRRWRGVAHLFGLPDVSFLGLPDLADIVRAPETRIAPAEALPPAPEQFVVCSASEPALPPDRSLRRVAAPRCDETGYTTWVKAIGICAQLLDRDLREVQIVAAVPLPEAGSRAEADLAAFLSTLPGARFTALPRSSPPGMASAFVQLAYPWVRTPAAGSMPEALESPDGVLIGLLARNALSQGAFRTAAGQAPVEVFDLVPSLRSDQIAALHAHVSLMGHAPDGIRLLADVTTSPSHSYRQAHIVRLMAAVLRAARTLGETLTFEVAGARLWRQVRDQLAGLMEGFRGAGALAGATAEEAYQVRCDRTTMTQNDIDNGRVIAELQFDPAAAVEAITVVLSLHEGGRVSLVEHQS